MISWALLCRHLPVGFLQSSGFWVGGLVELKTTRRSASQKVFRLKNSEEGDPQSEDLYADLTKSVEDHKDRRS